MIALTLYVNGLLRTNLCGMCVRDSCVWYGSCNTDIYMLTVQVMPQMHGHS